MSSLTVERVGKRFGPVHALREVSLFIPEGQLVCLLGPSGCGKTTLLRVVAGLEEPTAGRILLDGQDVTSLPAHRRGFGMVFQSLALFPHLTVGENIGYGLRVRGVDAATRARKAEELLELVRLPGIAGRHVSQLSGGQRQRVAIARALALQPKLFLLDEPLSALDAKLREEMQVELRLLQQRLNVTTILVTHDQREAMTMADLVVVMGEGRVHQSGPPLAIYRRPVDRFVASFIGSTNLLTGRAIMGAIEIAGQKIAVDGIPEDLEAGREATLCIRPEEVHVLAAGDAGPNRLPAEVVFVRDVGATIEITLDCAGQMLTSLAVAKDRPAVRQGESVVVELPKPACLHLPQ